MEVGYESHRPIGSTQTNPLARTQAAGPARVRQGNQGQRPD